MWLQDLMTAHLRSTARIMTFSYSLDVESGISLDNIKVIATELLDELLSQPRVFIPSARPTKRV